jgi:hypothetical protein
MTNDQPDQFEPEQPPIPARRRKGRSTFIEGPPERGNATAEELTWPVVTFRQRGRSTFIEGPPERGNATAEELTWPVVSMGSKVFGPPTSEAAIHPVEHELVELLQKLTAAERAPVLRRLQQLLLSHQSA